MKICTFIGHKDTPKKIEPILESALEALILSGVTKFYVGTHGEFDIMVQSVLKRLSQKYTQIIYYIVLAYLPEAKIDCKDYSNTIYPEGLEKTPLRFAILKRNEWMINNSDYLICYVNHTFSNANNFKVFAKKKGKQIINLYDSNDTSI